MDTSSYKHCSAHHLTGQEVVCSLFGKEEMEAQTTTVLPPNCASHSVHLGASVLLIPKAPSRHYLYKPSTGMLWRAERL